MHRVLRRDASAGLTDTGLKMKRFATGLCVPFVDISLRASFYSASHFSTEIRAREFAWPLKRHTVLYRRYSVSVKIQKELYKMCFGENKQMKS